MTPSRICYNPIRGKNLRLHEAHLGETLLLSIYFTEDPKRQGRGREREMESLSFFVGTSKYVGLQKTCKQAGAGLVNQLGEGLSCRQACTRKHGDVCERSRQMGPPSGSDGARGDMKGGKNR